MENQSSRIRRGHASICISRAPSSLILDLLTFPCCSRFLRGVEASVQRILDSARTRSRLCSDHPFPVRQDKRAKHQQFKPYKKAKTPREPVSIHYNWRWLHQVSALIKQYLSPQWFSVPFSSPFPPRPPYYSMWTAQTCFRIFAMLSS